MADDDGPYQPWQTARSASASAPPPLPNGPAAMPPLAPDYDEPEIWRIGRKLMMRREAYLPDRCVKTNGPADGGRVRRNLVYTPPIAYLGLLVGLLPYVILALVLRKTAKIEVPLSRRALRRRMTWILIAWGVLLVGVACLMICFALPPRASRDYAGPLVLAFVVCLLAALVLWVVISNMIVVPSHIDEQFITLKGVHPEYLAQFPEAGK